MKWFKISLSDINSEAQIQKVKVNDKEICLIKTDDGFYACETKCPHAGADLSRGWINKECHLVCPIHRYEYNLENGRGAEGQGDYLPVYKVENRENNLFVQLPEKWWKRLFRF